MKKLIIGSALVISLGVLVVALDRAPEAAPITKQEDVAQMEATQEESEGNLPSQEPDTPRHFASRAIVEMTAQYPVDHAETWPDQEIKDTVAAIEDRFEQEEIVARLNNGEFNPEERRQIGLMLERLTRLRSILLERELRSIEIEYQALISKNAFEK